jgi:hypothetical protein
MVHKRRTTLRGEAARAVAVTPISFLNAADASIIVSRLAVQAPA